MTFSIGDKGSSLLTGLSDFWQRFFKDTKDLEAFYQATEIYIGQAYLDLLSTVLNLGIVDTPVFNREAWKLFTIREDELVFRGGEVSVDDRYLYDMPGNIVTTDFLQNTIFDPTVVLEREVDFDVFNNDGFIRFREDPFRAYTDADGGKYPLRGVAWRYLNIQIGNLLRDARNTDDWRDSIDVRKGDSIRFLGYGGSVRTETPDFVADGSFIVVGPTTMLSSPSALFDSSYIGDVVEIIDSSYPDYNGCYLIASVVNPNTVTLTSVVGIPTGTSPGLLSWRVRKGVYYTDPEDYDVSYIDVDALVGRSTTPYPTGIKSRLIYALLRDRDGLEKFGHVLSTSTPSASESSTIPVGTFTKDVTGKVKVTLLNEAPFVVGMGVEDVGGPSDVKDYNWFCVPSGVLGDDGVFLINKADVDLGFPGQVGLLNITAESVGLETGDSINIYNWVIARTADSTPLDAPHVKPGTFELYAMGFFNKTLVENEDYTVDYLRGIFSPLKPINAYAVHTCSYKWFEEISVGSNGEIEETGDGKVAQLSFWVPQVSVDRFTLYYNYGQLLNRFAASSETYKAFLRGIMHLYMGGPTLKSIESALNVVASLPLIREDGETLLSYDNGVLSEGSDGVFTAPAVPLFLNTFYTPSYSFTELDVGSFIVVDDAMNELNQGSFRIRNVLDAHTVEVDTDYGVVDEGTLEWKFTRNYEQRVTTDRRTYVIPFNIPIREDIADPSSIGYLSFNAYEVLTTAFTVVDYLEDPTWYYNKIIPEVLWKDTSLTRRIAATDLYANIIAPLDGACIGDPGLFIGADDQGIVPENGETALRHTAAFVLFDRYLKFHMFYVMISDSLDFSDEFLQDLQDLVLVAKPSYAYPYIEPVRAYEDLMALDEEFQLNYGFLQEPLVEQFVADNRMFIGPQFGNYWKIGDYFKYVEYEDESTGVTPDGLTNPVPFVLSVSAGDHIIELILSATVAGLPVREGTHYTVDYDPDSVTYATVTPIGLDIWDGGAEILFSGRGINVVNLSTTPAPDTTLGYTPICIGGTNPNHIRNVETAPHGVEHIDRAIQLYVDIGGGTSYTY